MQEYSSAAPSFFRRSSRLLATALVASFPWCQRCAPSLRCTGSLCMHCLLRRFCPNEIILQRASTCLSQGMTWRLACQGGLHTGQRGAVNMGRAQDHRDALVGFGNAIVLVPVSAAASGGGAKNVAAGLTEGVGIGIAGMDEFRVPLKH